MSAASIQIRKALVSVSNASSVAFVIGSFVTSCKLTVCFEDPFWVGIVETEDGGRYRAARHVFGAEPSMPEVLRFVCDR